MRRIQLFSVVRKRSLIYVCMYGFHVLWFCLPTVLLGQITARGLGMGGAYTALARGVHAPQWNPANLGLPDNPKFSFTFVSVGAAVRNNSFNWGMLDRYGARHWTEQDIEDILSHIPDTGFDLDTRASVRALSFSAGRFALSFGAEAGSLVKLDKAFFQIPLKGNELDQSYNFNDSDGEGLGLGLVSLSMGQRVNVSFTEVFAIGATLHFLYGGAYAKTDRAECLFSTKEYGFNLDAEYELTYTYLGDIGFGLDLGAAAQFGGNWTVSCGLANVLGSVSWSGDIKREVGYVRGDSLTALGISEDEDEDEDVLLDSSWTVEGLPEFSTRLPIIFRLGVAYQEGPVLLTADLTKGFTDGPFFSSKPRISIGTEWRGISWLPLRMGVVMGGRIGLGTSVGFGFRPGGFVLDVGVMNRGFVTFNNSKGLILGVELGLDLQRKESEIVRVRDL